MSAFAPIASALPPKADIREGAAKRLLMTQSGRFRLSIDIAGMFEESSGECRLNGDRPDVG